jgi:hypothetical protein
MSPVFLSKSAHLCVRQDFVILLDLPSGKYMSLTPANSRALSGWVRGWPVSGAAGERPAVLQNLLDCGLLTEDPTSGREATPVTIERPVEMLADAEIPGQIKIRVSHVWHFCAALITARFAIRFLGIQSIARRIRKLRARLPRTHAPLDRAKASQLVATFEWLRPFVFGRADECLFHSLVLLEFLARHDICPDWVFAVRPTPFSAHCWLQQGGIVFNDRPMFVGALTPIMVL